MEDTDKTGPDNQVDPRIALAKEDEQAAMTEAMNQYLQQRVIMLNVEIRERDEIILERDRTIEGLNSRLESVSAPD